MKLWLLRPIQGINPNPWEPWYDKPFGLVIAAKTESEARHMADDQTDWDFDASYRDDMGVWKNPNFASCIELKADDYSGTEIIITDRHAA